MTETQHVIALNPYRKGNKGKVFSNSMAVYDKVIASPEIRKMIQQIRGELPIPKVDANNAEAVKKAQDRLKSELPFFCPHYGIFKNNVRRQENAQPESMLKLFTRITCVGATAKLALSIRQYDDDEKQAIKVVPPLLRKEVKTTIRHHGDYIMGYMLNTGFAEDVRAWHAKHPHTHLHFFWDKTDAPEELKVDDTLTLHRLDDVKFLKMMAGCRAYATTAGFESVCEALYMGKPCMLIPAHVEQECNAVDAEREMAGVMSNDFDIDKLKAFAHDYEEDVEFRMWENHADSRIMAAIENTYEAYYHRKENRAYEEEKDDSLVAASAAAFPARSAWAG